MRSDDAFLDSMRAVGDPIGDELVHILISSAQLRDANQLFQELTRHGTHRQNPPAPLANYLALTAVPPPWVDPALIEQGIAFFQQHGPQVLTILGSYSLPLDYAARKGVQVLARTARLTRTPNRRLVETAQMLIAIMQPGALQPAGAGLATLQWVRLIHAAVRHHIRAHDRTWRAEF